MTSAFAERHPEQLRSTCASTRDHLRREQPQHHAAGQRARGGRAARASPRRAHGERGLARLAEEDHAEELHHHVAGQRRRERDQRAAERQQHVDELPRHLVRGQECLQQQPLGDEAVERRQAGDGERPDQREPRDPGHAMDQPAEAAEIALARGVQHRPGADEQQALHERVVQAVVERRDQRERGQRPHLEPRNTIASPSAVKITPMFSMDDHASRRFMSVCTAAKTTP